MSTSDPKGGFCTIPTAVGPPHAGHLLNMLCNRMLYDRAVAQTNVEWTWNIIFDTEHDEFHQSYLDLHEALGWKVDRIILLQDWEAPPHLANAHLNRGIGARFRSSNRYKSGLSDHMYRLMAMHVLGVTMIARGTDLQRHYNEEKDLGYNFWPHLGIPLTVFHPMIVDKNGEKLSASKSGVGLITKSNISSALSRVKLLGFDPQYIGGPMMPNSTNIEPLIWRWS
jgi:hypothetical protein